ncbi:RelA/SpoT family protein [Deinococcus radiophilus]|nr:bifunctional (p)ppGpp synthetase/guanosine-3',5'-bis(diphosphate) 3'-pyrophosphohydrolase [Deinococcus radiophilus]UFA50740.1 bifunctional (p)ppGpp synthetase/guanosine-3',5'-bis(diphosphate) 3'-pyrophosphohydrolase [Deinococcus radiophilus]
MDILRALIAERPQAERDTVERAYEFARDAHEGVVRKSGEPYITHPVAVATILAELGMDTVSVTAGLLHDTVEDVDGVTFEVITDHFGTEVSRIVEGETKVSKLSKAGSQTAEVRDDGRDLQAENLRQMLIAMTDDLRIIVVKLADRLHNMRTMASMPEEKQKRISRETMEIFAPLAHRLGIGQVKWELEDLSFRYLYPAEYAELSSRLRMQLDERDSIVQQAEQSLRSALEDDLELPDWVIDIDISGRAKHLWSIYNKMRREEKGLEQIFDLMALRVILTPRPVEARDGTDAERLVRAEEMREKRICYHTISIVHSLWTPLPGRFKDYIAVPKPNGYQSLHTTVIGRSGQPIEIQIRSQRMHEVAEYGVAAHWMYKQGGQLNQRERDQWINQLRELQNEVGDATDYMDAVKNDFLSHRVRVFTPKGLAVSLTAGSTPVDFAYHIHTRIGETMVGARVNGKIVPLSHRLDNGDMVEILTSKNGKPSKDWLNFAATRSARTKIRYFFRQDERADALAHGQQMLERYLRKRHLPVRKLMSVRKLEDAAQELVGSRNPDELFLALHSGKVSTALAARTLDPELLVSKPLTGAPPPAQTGNSEQPKVYVEGLNTGTKLSQCCQPIRGDQIMGYLTRGRGVSIHRIDCPNMIRLLADEPERCVSASWNSKTEDHFEVNLDVTGPDRDGLLADILSVLAANKQSPLRFEAFVDSQESAHVCLRLGFGDNQAMRHLISELGSVSGVREVRRTRGFGQMSLQE